MKRDYGTNECGMGNAECGMGNAEWDEGENQFIPFPIPHSAFRIRLFRNLFSFHQPQNPLAPVKLRIQSTEWPWIV
jgi:hypothetical protein